MKPNLLILTLDSFRRDRTSLHGYAKTTTPNLERLAERAIVCENASALSCWTQPSLLTAFTSSRPFDHGGFDEGVKGRRTIFDQLSKAGYLTVGISTTPWVSRYFGYRFDVEEYHFSLNALFGCYTAQMSSYLEKMHRGEWSVDETHEAIAPIFWRMVSAIREFEDRDYAMDHVRRILQTHAFHFQDLPRDYIRHHLSVVPRSHEWLAARWRWARSPTWLVSKAVSRTIGALAAFLGRNAQPRRFMSGQALADRIMHHAKKSRQPFAIWGHFHDTHSPYLGSAKSVSESVSDRYDAAMGYTDHQIGRIVSGLKALDLDENTIIAISADHGEELGDHGDWGHRFRLYEHNVAIPMMFHAPWIKAERFGRLVTLLDFSPMLAAMTGARDDGFGWKGKSIYNIPDRDHVILETVHGGTCDLRIRPPYMAVKTKRHKFMWKEYLDPRDSLGSETDEIYSLDMDPNEQTNWYGRSDHGLAPEPVRWYIDRIMDRLAEVPRFSRERLNKAREAA